MSRINFIWTLRALGSCVSTLVTGAVFRSLVTRPGEKLTFLASCVLLTGLFMGLVPWASSFYGLLISKIQSNRKFKYLLIVTKLKVLRTLSIYLKTLRYSRDLYQLLLK